DPLLLLEPHTDLEGRPVREAQTTALLGRVARATELVADVLESHLAVERLDGEDLAQDRLEAEVLALPVGHVALQEIRIAAGLQVHEVRDVEDLLDLSELH